MFGLSDAHYNIVKQAARRCSAELEAEIRKGKPKASDRAKRYNDLAKDFIDRHHAPVAVLISRIRFMWLIGYLNERFGKDDGEYE